MQKIYTATSSKTWYRERKMNFVLFALFMFSLFGFGALFLIDKNSKLEQIKNNPESTQNFGGLGLVCGAAASSGLLVMALAAPNLLYAESEWIYQIIIVLLMIPGFTLGYKYITYDIIKPCRTWTQRVLIYKILEMEDDTKISNIYKYVQQIEKPEDKDHG